MVVSMLRRQLDLDTLSSCLAAWFSLRCVCVLQEEEASDEESLALKCWLDSGGRTMPLCCSTRQLCCSSIRPCIEHSQVHKLIVAFFVLSERLNLDDLLLKAIRSAAAFTGRLDYDHMTRGVTCMFLWVEGKYKVCSTSRAEVPSLRIRR